MNVKPTYDSFLESVSLTFEQEGDTASCKENDITVQVLDIGVCPYVVIKAKRFTLSYKEIDGFADWLKSLVDTLYKSRQNDSPGEV